MATDPSLLQGEINENPAGDELDVEKLLILLLRSLIQEERLRGEE